MSRRRKVLVWSGVALLALAGVAAAAWLRCADAEAPERTLPRPCACEAVSNAIEQLERTFAADFEAVRLDVRKMTCGELRGILWPFFRGDRTATLWMPGESDWVVLRRRGEGSVSLAALMERFGETDGDDSLPGLFASYVGEVSEVMPAFSSLRPDDAALPELFVTKELPRIGWLDVEGVDPDILASVQAEVRKVQEVRREVLEGCILARGRKPEAALDKWAAAAARNPRDQLIRERLQVLALNAKVFARVGKYGMAANCYETILCIEPGDYAATVNLAACLERLGKRDYAARAYERAERMRKGAAEGK